MSLTYVVDCSLVIEALAARAEDDLLRQRLSAPRTLHAPHHLDVEVASAVPGPAAGKKITTSAASRCSPITPACASRATRSGPANPRMWELRQNLGAYDAAYIALAEALGCELLTGDLRLKTPPGTMRQ